ncbi:hypothetical protein LZ30DRAFT_791367, partial [Colletotrichum cereale]
ISSSLQASANRRRLAIGPSSWTVPKAPCVAYGPLVGRFGGGDEGGKRDGWMNRSQGSLEGKILVVRPFGRNRAIPSGDRIQRHWLTMASRGGGASLVGLDRHCYKEDSRRRPIAIVLLGLRQQSFTISTAQSSDPAAASTIRSHPSPASIPTSHIGHHHHHHHHPHRYYHRRNS